MKYEAYITDSDKIFWTKNSVDKPTKNYFLSLMNEIEWKELGNITPNFINQFNGSITVDKDTYTYLKLVNVNTREEKFFSVDSVSKVLSNGFVIDITLDVFTTYTLNFYDSIKDKPIHVNRTTSFGIFSTNIQTNLQHDPLLSIQYNAGVYNNKNELYSIDFKYRATDGNKGRIFIMKNNNEWTHETDFVQDVSITEFQKYARQDGYLYSLTLFDFYQDIQGDWYIVPIFGENYYSNTSSLSWIYQTVRVGGIYYTCRNLLTYTNLFKSNTFWVNKYVGRFYIPMWINLVSSHAEMVIVKFGNNPNNSNCLMMFKINKSLFEGIKWDSGIKTTFDFRDKCIINFKRNSNKVNAYFIIKLTQENENPVFNIARDYSTKNVIPKINDVQLWIDYPHQNLGKKAFSVSNSQGITWYNSQLPYNIVLYSNESFPVSTDSYKQYLAGVQSSQNASIEIAKQQRDMGIFRSTMNSLSQGLNAVGTYGANPLFALGGLISANTTFYGGIAQSVLQYENTKRQIDAQNADKQRSLTANNINTSNIKSNITNSRIELVYKPVSSNKNIILERINFASLDGIIANKPFNKLNVQYYNKLVWESGYYINNTLVLTDIRDYRIDIFDDYINNFIYWDIEIPVEYVKLEYTNLNNELISAIATTINNPVRFWNIYPDYNIELRMGLLLP